MGTYGLIWQRKGVIYQTIWLDSTVNNQHSNWEKHNQILQSRSLNDVENMLIASFNFASVRRFWKCELIFLTNFRSTRLCFIEGDRNEPPSIACYWRLILINEPITIQKFHEHVSWSLDKKKIKQKFCTTFAFGITRPHKALGSTKQEKENITLFFRFLMSTGMNDLNY